MGALEPRPANEIVQVAKRSVRVALGDDAVGEGSTDSADIRQSHPHREVTVATMCGGVVGCAAVERRNHPVVVVQTRIHSRDSAKPRLGLFEPRLDTRSRDARNPHLDTVAFGVGDERRRRIEPHRLRSHEPDEECGGVVDLEPGRHVDEQRERKRVRFGEPEVGERLECSVDAVGGRTGDAVRIHPAIQRFANRGEPFDSAFRTDGSANHVGVGRGAPTDRHRNLHELFLKDGNSERSSEYRFQFGVVVNDGFDPGSTPNVGVNAATLNRAGANHCYFDGDVVETPRLEPGQ